jgi:hypothetical protein
MRAVFISRSLNTSRRWPSRAPANTRSVVALFVMAARPRRPATEADRRQRLPQTPRQRSQRAFPTTSLHPTTMTRKEDCSSEDCPILGTKHSFQAQRLRVGSTPPWAQRRNLDLVVFEKRRQAASEGRLPLRFSDHEDMLPAPREWSSRNLYLWQAKAAQSHQTIFERADQFPVLP